MTEPLVRVENASKKFSRSLRRSLYYGVRELAGEMIGRRAARDRLRKSEFWAIDDVSFEVSPGDSLGLIGPNGAGKTTLLRMLSGLIKPDMGRIAVRGRMQALIALGAGFNPILTGRENIYINGAVLGISKAEIDRQLDSIIDFSGIVDFIDAPVQSYSSGMVVRLGFSVAIHMEPDLLLVDEVLAVGDVPFRAKCARKLAELKDRGVPWILVSHDMGTIRNQTNRVILLDHGRARFIGAPDDAISAYLLSVSESQEQMSIDADVAPEALAQSAHITGVRLVDGDDKEQASFETGGALCIEIHYEAHERLERPSFGVAFYGTDGTCYTGTNTQVSEFEIDAIHGAGCVRFRLPFVHFLPGIYRVRIDLHDRHMGICDTRPDAAQLRIDGGRFGAGMFHPLHAWEIE